LIKNKDFQNTISESTPKIEGINAFSGKRNYIVFHPAVANAGLVVRVNGENIPVKLSSASHYKSWKSLRLASSISLKGERQRAIEVEHILAIPYALHLDNLIIELSDGSFPRQTDGMVGMARELLARRVALSEERRYLRIREGLKSPSITRPGKQDKLQVKSANDFYIDYSAFYPHKSVGKQEYRFRFSDEGFQNEIMGARAIFFLPFGSRFMVDSPLLRTFHGARDDNALFVGNVNETAFLNRSPGSYGRDEFVRHKIYDTIGELALTGRYFKDTEFVFERTGHAFDIFALRELVNANNFTSD